MRLVALALMLSSAVAFRPVGVARLESTALYAAKKKGARRLQELRQLDGANSEKTAAFADKLIDRLDEAAAFVETESALLEQCEASERNLDRIDSLVNELLQQQQSTRSVLPSGDFRLVWARTDDAIAEIGTGLHRVPLARMEELFVSLLAGDEIRLTEVVRVIGPFPNVKNLLFGTRVLAKGTLTVSYQNGYDGTGKQLSGSDRTVDFTVAHASKDVIVLDALRAGTRSWLVFQRESNLPESLERLRVPANDDASELRRPN